MEMRLLVWRCHSKFPSSLTVRTPVPAVNPVSPGKRMNGVTTSPTNSVVVPSTKTRFGEIAVGQVVVGLAAIELQGRLQVGTRFSEAPLAHVIQASLNMVPELHFIDLLVFDVESVADTHEFDRVRAQDGAQVRDVGLQAAQLLRRG